jgi:RNA polymerase sigma-70 factor (ECF subfamily)
VPFEEIATIVERSPAATRQLASRARRRVKENAPVPDADLARQRQVVEAFLAAAREGDFEALVALLDPDVVLRADYGAVPGAASKVVRGARKVAGQALAFARLSRSAEPALVNGAAGMVTVLEGRAVAVMGVTVTGGRIAAMDILADPARLRHVLVEDSKSPDGPRE